MRSVSRLDVVVGAVSVLLLVLIGGLAQAAQRPLVAGFPVQGERVLYLAPADARANLWAQALDSTDAPQQLTFSEAGLQSFVVSADGRQLVYTEYVGASRDTRLMLLDLQTGNTRSLTTCADSSCGNPVISPDGRWVAYERVAFNSVVEGVPASPPRVWLVDLQTLAFAEQPLEPDTQRLSMMPRWSPDGRYLTVMDRAGGGVRVYDMAQGTSFLTPESYEQSGTFSPDSQWLIFPALVEDGTSAHLELQRLTLADNSIITLKTDIADYRPVVAMYSPDGRHLAVLHLPRESACISGTMLHLAALDAAVTTLTTLTADEYCVQQVAWDAAGERLLMQRTPMTETVTTDIWLYTLADANAVPIVTNAYHPRWLR